MVRRRLDVRADVLKVGHHGSASSTSDRWLDAVRPRAAIISVGGRNPFGHPDRRVISRLERRGIRVFRTDERGAITVLSDGARLSVRPLRRVR
jgi:competence protein ComEC